MKTDHYPEKIKNLIEECSERRFADPDRVFESSEDIRRFASENDDIALSGFADFYSADAFFTKYNSAACTKYLKAAVEKLLAASEWQQLGECYNLLGVLSEQHGIFSTSSDSYSEAIRLSREYNLTLLACMAYANYSNLLQKSGRSDAALKAALACREYLKKETEDSRYIYLKIRIQVNLAKLYVNMRRKEDAGREIEILEGLYSDNSEISKELDYYYLKLIYSDLIGSSSGIQDALKELIEAFLKSAYKVDYLDECLGMLEFFKQKGHYDLMKIVLPVFKKFPKSNDFLNAQINISNYRIELLQHEGRWGSLLEEYRHYRELSIKHKEQVLDVLKLRSEIRHLLGRSADKDILAESNPDSIINSDTPLMIML